MDRGAGPEIGDYGGIPINEPAVSSRCRTTRHASPCGITSVTATSRRTRCARSGTRGHGRSAIPKTHRLMAIHWFSQTFEGKRTIWMDGRPHPPAYAPHSWMGFSTGRFVGNALEVRTTHLKQGWYRRNGMPESDQATLVEFFVRHGDRLTHTVVVSDPVYLEEPLVTTTDFFRQPTDHQDWLFPCDDGEQVLGRRRTMCRAICSARTRSSRSIERSTSSPLRVISAARRASSPRSSPRCPRRRTIRR